jgi:predicted transcriptional regulator
MIGWFLQNAASSAYAQVNFQKAINGVTVAQAMQQDMVRVPTLTPLSYLIEGYVLNRNQSNFLVEEGEQISGILTLQEIMAVPQSRWRFTTAQQAMQPITRSVQVNADTELITALETMENAQVGHICVLEQEKLVGILSRDQLKSYLRLRMELGV